MPAGRQRYSDEWCFARRTNGYAGTYDEVVRCRQRRRRYLASAEADALAATNLRSGGEAGDGRGIAVEHVEHRHQLRDLQHFLELRSQIGEL